MMTCVVWQCPSIVDRTPTRYRTTAARSLGVSVHVIMVIWVDEDLIMGTNPPHRGEVCGL